MENLIHVQYRKLRKFRKVFSGLPVLICKPSLFSHKKNAVIIATPFEDFSAPSLIRSLEDYWSWKKKRREKETCFTRLVQFLTLDNHFILWWLFCTTAITISSNYLQKIWSKMALDLSLSFLTISLNTGIKFVGPKCNKPILQENLRF